MQETLSDGLIQRKSLTKDKLVVCIHGLNHSPMAFKRILDEMKKRDNFNEADIFIPHVLERGNGKLDDMIKPIFEEIKKWAQKEGDKELVLVGISNGGRIARALEVEVAKSKDLENIKKLRLVSIVGACKGSSLVNLANRLGLSCFLSKNISEEMPKDSLRNQQLNNEWQEMQSKGPEREYAFIASPHDWHVPNYSSSLMRTGSAKALYGIIAGYGHISAPNGAAQAIAELVFRKNILD